MDSGKPLITSLIDKKDGFEIVGDLIALILEVEIKNQQILAQKANKKNLKDFNFEVRRERANPIEDFRAIESEKIQDAVPIINVWYDNSGFPRKGGNVVERQTSSSIYNIDCYGLGISENEQGAGHKAGDEQAARNVQNCAKLVRNILMSSHYVYLGTPRGFVGKRWVDSINAEQAEFNNDNGLHVRAARIIFNVDFNEFSPQYEGETLEQVYTKLKRASDDFLIAEVNLDNLEAEGE